VDYRDGAGTRRWVTCDTKEEANNVLADKIKESGQAVVPVTQPNITVKDYASGWMESVRANLRPGTVRVYQSALDAQILKAFGPVRVRKLTKQAVKQFLVKLRNGGMKPKSVAGILAVLRAMLAAAVEDGLVLINPAEKAARRLRLGFGVVYEVKAMDREQVAVFLKTAQTREPQHHGLFFLMARTGLRLGEAVALQWADLDFARREMRVERAISGSKVGATKTGKVRTVDMSTALMEVLKRLDVARKEKMLEGGQGESPEWVFPNTFGRPLDHSHANKAFKRVLKAAELPLHFHPHCLRHSFASLLLQQGESPAYVQRQLGHSSIKMTVDTYGRWLPMGNKAAVDRLDVEPEARGSKTVANSASQSPTRA